MEPTDYRQAIAEYIRAQAQPTDKFSHQPRLYEVAKSLAHGEPYDDAVLYAAAWLHDLGVFTGHRPENLAELASWDHVAYAMAKAPALLRSWAFPPDKIPAVIEAIRTHLPSRQPTSKEGVLLRDADILEQLGAVGIVRMVSKVGRDTRYSAHGDAVRALRKSALELPNQLQLPLAREMAKGRLALMREFFEAIDQETGGMAFGPFI